MTDIAKIDKQAYILAKSYLPNLGINGVTANLIEKYLNPLTINPKPTSKEGIYQRILESAQNANMKAGVIGRAIGGVGRLSHVLEDFNPKAVLNKYLLFKSIIRVAGHANVSAYDADKVFWLIGSGYFYDDSHIGTHGRIGSRKQEFIEHARAILVCRS